MKRLLAVGIVLSSLLGASMAQDVEQFQLPPLDGLGDPAPSLDATQEGLPPVDPTEGLPPLDPGAALPPVQPNEGLAEAPPAERIRNRVAEFSGIDKITGRITSFDVYVDETVQFGALQVTPRVCYTSPPSEPPQTDSFVEVDEITLDREIRRIFTGWMFSDSPGLNAVEHPVYDVWLKSCKTDSAVPPPAG